MDAPGTHGVGDTGDLNEVVVLEEVGAGVDVIQIAAVDADGGEEASVIGDGSEVLTDIAVFEEDAAAGVAALDGAVGVVPLVDPADVKGGLGAVVELGDVSAGCDEAKEGKDTVDEAGVVGTGDYEAGLVG
jgi:hypothetical protein